MDPYSLALFRIALGVLITGTYLCLLPNWDRYFSSDGILSLHDSRFAGRQDVWSLWYWTQDLVPNWMWWPVGFGAAVAFTLGWRTKMWSIVLYIFHSSLIHRSRIVVNGEDLVFRMVLFYACFLPLDQDLSLTAHLRNRAGTPVPEHPSGWPLRLLQINIACIYAFSLPVKLTTDAAWLDGTALYFVMVDREWSRWPWPSVFYNAWPGRILTYSTILLEGAFPLMVWWSRTRVPLTLLLMSLHVGIAVFVKNVAFFSLSMTASLLCFVPGNVSRRFFEDRFALFLQRPPDPDHDCLGTMKS